MKYIVLIADIIESKSIEDRSAFQSDLKELLSKINKNSDSLVSPYTVTLGDEFQAVYKNIKTIFSDIFKILDGLYPVRIRFSICYGEISTEINNQSSIGMDGPAFYTAREGINNLKNIDYSIVQFYGNKIIYESLINKSLKLSLSIMSDWKKNTFRIFEGLYRNMTIKEIAQLLNITERGVYKNIDTNKVRNFVDYFDSLEDTILSYLRQ